MVAVLESGRRLIVIASKGIATKGRPASRWCVCIDKRNGITEMNVYARANYYVNE
jgi:hypothetical protein